MPYLLYGHDPLCGWCYGFIPAMEALTTTLPELEVRLMLGGLVTGDRIGPYADQRKHLTETSARMAELTGQKLGEAFFTKIIGGDVLSSSLPPSEVLCAVRAAAPAATLAVAHAIQRAHFRDGSDLNDPATYAPILAAHAPGVSIPPLDPHMPSPVLASELASAREQGIQSFPAVLLVDGDSRRMIQAEYRPDAFVSRVRRALST
jgi:putative protein-disulfide isomerase